MASTLKGRTACPECGFHAAHVKQKDDKDNAKPYRHCPECGAQYFPRNKTQADALMAKTRPEGSAPPVPEPTPEQVSVTRLTNIAPAPFDQAPPPAKFKTVLGVRVPV
jgi:predicted  nucleic acid-binding Zn-ribbon protein